MLSALIAVALAAVGGYYYFRPVRPNPPPDACALVDLDNIKIDISASAAQSTRASGSNYQMSTCIWKLDGDGELTVIVSHVGRKNGLSASAYIDKYAIPKEVSGHVSSTTIGDGGKLVTGSGDRGYSAYAWIRVSDFSVHVDLGPSHGVGNEAQAARSVSDILVDIASSLEKTDS